MRKCAKKISYNKNDFNLTYLLDNRIVGHQQIGDDLFHFLFASVKHFSADNQIKNTMLNHRARFNPHPILLDVKAEIIIQSNVYCFVTPPMLLHNVC